MRTLLQKRLAAILLLMSVCSLMKAQTNVSGGIYANATWTLAGSPYIVVDTIVVFPGVTLTVDPGVVVKFNTGKLLEIRQACLLANGTAADSITFTSNSSTPYLGIWDKVWLHGGTMISQFNYCNFHYALRGLAYETDSTLIVRNSNFISNVNGISTWNNSPHAIAVIDTSNFMSNSFYGLDFFSYGGAVSINYCNISNNGTGLFGVTNLSVAGVIKNCLINSNQTGLSNIFGLLIDSCILRHNQVGIEALGFNLIRYCSVDSNTITGVWTNGSIYGDTIRNSHIHYNGKGITARSSLILHNDIQYNGTNVVALTSNVLENIIKNGSIGIDSTYLSDISGNIIENNDTGIRVIYIPNSLSCNRICNNSLYDLEYLATTNFTAPNNYWCTTDSLSTTAVIYDGYDNINYGLVTFMPLDTSCYLNGCSLMLNASVTNATCDTCHNGAATAIVSNGVYPYTYTWLTTPIQTTQTATGLASGTYTVCVTDAIGCTACNSNVFVDSTNCAGFSVSTTATNASCTSCTDGSATATITGGSPPYMYTWYTSPIQNTQTATGLSIGTYAVCVGDAYGCTACDTVTVGIGNCSAYFDLYPDTVPHYYYAVNMASGIPPLSFDWSWGDGSPHDTIPYPSHTYAVAGFYAICLSITDSVGCTDSVCTSYFLTRATNNMIYVNVVASLPTGIVNSYDDNFFSVYPNPSFAFINIDLQGSVTEEAQIKIYDMLGKAERSLLTMEPKNIVDTSKLPRGVYFVEVISATRTGRQKFIKQ